jgi:hypothetical protein
MALVLVARATQVSCDTFPSRGKIGADELVNRVELDLDDKKHSKTKRLLWAVEAEAGGGTATRFTAGQTPPGYREVVAFAGPLRRHDPISAVVTSSLVGKWLLDFEVRELKADRVLVNRSPRHVSQARFNQRVRKLCANG